MRVCACVRLCACVRARGLAYVISSMCSCIRDRTNVECHSNRISNRISPTFRIRIEYRFEYEYSVYPNSIRMLESTGFMPTLM